jgi:chromosome segregation ATPase
METQGQPPGSALSPSGESHDKLRELRDRARAALDEQRRHMRDLEQRIVSQFESVAGEIAEDLVAQARDAATDGNADRDLLHRERVDWEAEQALAEAQLQTQLEQLRARDYELTQREEQLDLRYLEATDEQEALAEQRVAVEALQQQLAAQQQELAERQAQLDQRHAEFDALAEESAEERRELASAQEALAGQRSELEQLRGELEGRQAELAAQQQSLDERLAQLDARQGELDQWAAGLATERDALAAERQSLAEGQGESQADYERQRSELVEAHEAELARLQTELDEVVAAREELQQRLTTLEQQLASSGTDSDEWQVRYEAERAAWEAEREKFVQERDKLSSNFRQTREKLEQAEKAQQSNGDTAELEHKFQLAIADVQALRQQNADLEQQLARRPDVDGGEAAEVVCLREERDQLVERIEELERRPARAHDDDFQQEHDDLQRRFEMAVEEVRSLRRQQSELEEKLASKSAERSASASADTGAMDWEAQKRRLLASLEGEDGEEVSAVRAEERTTIEGTIRITDEVVAEKDRQIAELEQQMRQMAETPAPQSTLTSQHEELLSSDEVIRAEREKLARLEQELNDALRKAELELSLERAKIARERTHMEELQEEVETLRGQAPGDRGGAKGRGRWLSKLGLGGEEPLS